MKKIILKYSLFLFLCFCMLNSAFAQKQPTFSIGATGGTMTYYGDLTDEYPRINEHYNEYAYGVQLEAAMGAKTRFRLSASKGQIRYNDRTRNAKGEFLTDNPNFDRRLNFQTDIQDASLSFVFHSTNATAFLRPYFTLGFGITKYDVFADLISEEGMFYNYDENPELVQDGDFETDLRLFNMENAFYDETTWHIPVGLGLQFRLAPKLHFNLETNIKYTFSDYLDDVDKRGNDDRWNDMYAYTQAGLVLSFGGGKKNKSAYNAPKIIVGEYANQTTPIAKPENTSIPVNEPLASTELAPIVDKGNGITPVEPPSNPNVEPALSSVPAPQTKPAPTHKSTKKEAKAHTKNCLQSCDELGTKAERKACKKQCKMTKKTGIPHTTTAPLPSPTTDNSRILTTTDSNTSTPTIPSSATSKDCEDVEQLKTQLALMQAELTQLKQNQQPNSIPQATGNPTSATYDPVVELYKLEADRLREDNSNTKIIHEIQQLRSEVASLKNGGSTSNTTASIQQSKAIPPMPNTQKTVPSSNNTPTTNTPTNTNTDIETDTNTALSPTMEEVSPIEETTNTTTQTPTENLPTDIAPIEENNLNNTTNDAEQENEVEKAIQTDLPHITDDKSIGENQSGDKKPTTSNPTPKKIKQQKDDSSVDCCPDKEKKKFNFFGLFKKKDKKNKPAVQKERKPFDFFGLFKKKDKTSATSNQ